MTSRVLSCLVLLLFLLHQDAWFWSRAQPVVLSLLPVSLFYHAVYCVVASVMMWLLVRHAWPTHLEREAESSEPPTDAQP